MKLAKLFSNRKRQRPRRQRTTHLRIECLEGRTLLSTFTVLNLADSGAGSLRAAVQAAEAHPGADVIQFANGVKGTITEPFACAFWIPCRIPSDEFPGSPSK